MYVCNIRLVVYLCIVSIIYSREIVVPEPVVPIPEATSFSSSSPSKSKIVVEKLSAANHVKSTATAVIKNNVEAPASHLTTQMPLHKLNQLSCTQVPDDEKIFQFVSIIDTKMPPGVAVAKTEKIYKIQVRIVYFLLTYVNIQKNSIICTLPKKYVLVLFTIIDCWDKPFQSLLCLF